MPLTEKQWDIYCTKELYALEMCKYFCHNTLFLIEYNMPLCRWNNEHVLKINVLALDAESLGLHFCVHSTPEAVPTSTNTLCFLYPNFSCLPITECFKAVTTQYCFLLQTSILPTWKSWRTLLPSKTPVDLYSSGV